MFRALERGDPLSDEVFDQVYYDGARRLSALHWTPLAVARRAAQLLVTDANTKVLDVGSGAGKFCHIGASTTTGTFVGVEQRQYLSDEAARVAAEYGVVRAKFVHGNMMDLDWSEFHAVYLYNPFYEHVEAVARIDAQLPVSKATFDTYVGVVAKKLMEMPIGTRVVTYHGYGGHLPDGYDDVHKERAGSDVLCLWVKRRRPGESRTVQLA